MRPSVGLTLGGRYELISRIATGGMGEVWRATDLVIGREVAIKILKDEFLDDPGFRERFRAEARHAALVNHDGIANVYDYGEEEGNAYLVMELVPGEALSTILEREHVLSSDRVLDIVAQTSAALHAAHSAGLVHRDIKPGNLLITPDGRVKITDFGIARIADQVPLTATGQVMGTVQYLSPEQASGFSANVTTDVYSLGIVAYEALAGKRPFTGESQVAIAMAQINDTPPALPVTVSEPVRNLVDTCLAKNPSDRPATAAALSTAASALRRGDLAGAVAAVPGIAGSSAVPATVTMPIGSPETDAFATILMPNVSSKAPATQIMGTTTRRDMRVGQASAPATKKRNPWTWPLIGLVGLLIVALIFTILGLLINQNKVEFPKATSTVTATPRATPTAATRPTETVAPTPTGTPTPSVASIDREKLLTMTVEDAGSELVALGFGVNKVRGDAAPDAEQTNYVYDVNPYGPVATGTTITLTYYAPPAVPKAPTLAPSASSKSISAGGTVDITWPAQSCASGKAQGYRMIVSGDASAAENGVTTSTNGTVTANNTPGGKFTVAYTYFCGAVESTPSPSVTIDIKQNIVPSP